MKANNAAIGAIVVVLAGVITIGLVTSGSTASAEEHQLPGMCNGRSDANVVLIAHANGKPVEVPKYILNLSTDAVGDPFGTLVLGKAKDRLIVEDWCRLWMHRPGDVPGGAGQCEGEDDGHDPDEEGAVTAHAVGIGRIGTAGVLVRTDLRSNEDGMFFRVRYRPMGEHHGEDARVVQAAAHEDDEGCEDGGWIRMPAEGWAPLDQLRLRVNAD